MSRPFQVLPYVRTLTQRSHWALSMTKQSRKYTGWVVKKRLTVCCV